MKEGAPKCTVREMTGKRREEFLHWTVGRSVALVHGRTADPWADHGPACTVARLIPGSGLTFLVESSSDSDTEAWSLLDLLTKKDFLVLLPKNFFFFGEKDDA